MIDEDIEEIYSLMNKIKDNLNKIEKYTLPNDNDVVQMTGKEYKELLTYKAIFDIIKLA